MSFKGVPPPNGGELRLIYLGGTAPQRRSYAL
jgi:hypothetical protein